MANGATLAYPISAGNVYLTRPIALGPGGATISSLTGNTFWLQGALSGSGPLTTINAGTGGIVLNWSTTTGNNLTSLTVAGGKTFIKDQTSLGNATVNVNSGAILTDYYGGFAPTNAMTFASGAGIGNWVGTLTLSTSNSMFPSSGTLNYNIGSDSGGNATINGNYPLLTGGMTFNAANNTLTLNGALSDAGGGSLTKVGGGSLVLAGSTSNTYTGTTALYNGNLYLSKSNGAYAVSGPVLLGAGDTNQPYLYMTQNNQFAPGVVLSNSNAQNNWTRFEMNGTNQTLAGINDALGGLVIENQAASTTATLTIANTANYSVASQYIRDNGGVMALTKTGSGVLSLSGGNLTYSGPTTISGGTVTLTSSLNGTTLITVGSGAVLNLAGGNNQLQSGIANPESATNGGTLAVSGLITDTNAGANTVYPSTVVLSGGTMTSTQSVVQGAYSYGAFFFNVNRTITANGAGNVISAINIGIQSNTLTLNTPLPGDAPSSSTSFVQRDHRGRRHVGQERLGHGDADGRQQLYGQHDDQRRHAHGRRQRRPRRRQLYCGHHQQRRLGV